MTAVPNEKPYTVADIEAMPEDQRAELIDGDLYLLAAPSLIHQILSRELLTAINVHIKENGIPCDVFAAPFAVYIGGAEDNYNYVEPDISVICDETKLTDKGCRRS
jgi:Uma2 family endonuclease